MIQKHPCSEGVFGIAIQSIYTPRMTDGFFVVYVMYTVQDKYSTDYGRWAICPTIVNNITKRARGPTDNQRMLSACRTVRRFLQQRPQNRS